MTIELMSFEPPLNVSDASQIDLDSAALFAKKQQIPAGFKRTLTPKGYRDEYILRTLAINNNGRDDTVGEVEVVGHGKKISGYEGNRFLGDFTLKETEEQTMKQAIDENTPLMVIARPNALDGGDDGFRIDHIIRYIPSEENI